MSVEHFQQVVSFAVINVDVLRIAFVLHVGGADDGELIHPRDDKHDTVIFVLQNISLLLGMNARHHDVAAFDQADTVRRFQFQAVIKQLLNPRASGVDQAFRLPGKGFAGIDIFRFNLPQATFTPGTGYTGAGADFTATLHHFLRIQYYHAGIIDPAVRIFESARNFRLQGRIRAKPQTFTAWQAGTLAEMVIHEQTGADHPRRTQVRTVRQTEAHRERQMRGHFQQDFALGQCFTDQTEFVMFKVAQAAVNQF